MEDTLVITPDPGPDVEAEPAAEQDEPILVWVFDDSDLGKGTIKDFAEFVAHLSYIDVTMGSVYTVADAQLVEVTWEAKHNKVDDNHWIHAVLTVTLPDGKTINAPYRVDGRA